MGCHNLYHWLSFISMVAMNLSSTDIVYLTHWGRVTHIWVGKLINIGSDNGLSPGRRQAITWPNAGILFIGPLGTNFSEFLIVIHTFSFNKMHLKMSSAKWRPFCLSLNVLTCNMMTPWYGSVFLIAGPLWAGFPLTMVHWCGSLIFFVSRTSCWTNNSGYLRRHDSYVTHLWWRTAIAPHHFCSWLNI